MDKIGLDLDRRLLLGAGAVLALVPAALAQSVPVPSVSVPSARARPLHASTPATRMALIQAASAQIGVTTLYDAAYVRLGFPGGDVPIERGVCTDVIVRAYRVAFGFDLQSALNEDMTRNFSAYPRRWGLSQPDPHIDHRRVPNLQTYFRRRGAEQPLPATAADWQPGDLVTQVLFGGRPHIGIIADTRTSDGARPLVIHNIGRGTEVSDILDLFKASGRYSFAP